MREKEEKFKPGFISHKEFEYGKKLEGYNDNCFLTEEILTKPLYRKISIKGLNYTDIFPMNDLNLHLFCKKCMKRRWYQFAYIGENGLRKDKDKQGEIIGDRKSKLRLKTMTRMCDWFYFVGKAECGHNLIVMFERIDRDYIKKVGQSPSPEAINEKIVKPSIDRFVRRYMQPMWDYEIEELNNQEIKEIKKRYRKEEYAEITNLRAQNKISLKKLLHEKAKIEEKEGNEIAEVYNKIFNIPYDNPIETYKYKRYPGIYPPKDLCDFSKEREFTIKAFSFYW